jgi:hypothetical protein
VIGEKKIYALDQQYDATRIIKSKGERYVSTDTQAEKIGIRCARRHFVDA